MQGMLLDVPASATGEQNHAPEAPPQFRMIDRNQLLMRTLDVEQLVAPDHSVRAIWALSEQVDWTMYAQEVQAVQGWAGMPPWNPRLLACVWIYAYTQGIGSSREIARRFAFDPAFQWLAGMEQINYHTLADFRTEGTECGETLHSDTGGAQLPGTCRDGTGHARWHEDRRLRLGQELSPGGASSRTPRSRSGARGGDGRSALGRNGSGKGGASRRRAAPGQAA